MAKAKKKVGRPRLSKNRCDEVLRLYRASDVKMSIRALARELGLSPYSVTRVLREAGLLLASERKDSSCIEKTDTDTGSNEGDTRPSLRMVARKAGLSVSTVSLALRGSPRVSEGTRGRVVRIANQLNYEAHPYIGAQLSAVRRGRVRKVKANLAYLYSGYHGTTGQWKQAVQLPYGPQRYFDAAERAARQRGYHLEPLPYVEEDRPMARLGKILKARSIQGLILDAPSYVVSDHPFDFSGFTVVSFREQYGLSSHVFGHDNFLNTLRSFCQLWRMGYRRIGCIVSDAVSVSTLFAREAAIQSAQYHLMEEGLRLPILHCDQDSMALFRYIHHGIVMDPRNRADAYQWAFAKPWKEFISRFSGALPSREEIELGLLQRWISEQHPEVIICENKDIKTLLEKLGHSVPQDIGLVHTKLNDDVKGWTGITRADEMIGKAAAEQLCNSIELGQIGTPPISVRQFFPGEWHVGDTTKMIEPSSPYTAQADRFIRRVLGEPLYGE